MKNKVLNFIIAVLLSLSSLVNTSGVIVQANKNIEPKIFISVKSFKDFLDDIDKIDLENYYNNTIITIPLDNTISPSYNAKKYLRYITQKIKIILMKN